MDLSHLGMTFSVLWLYLPPVPLKDGKTGLNNLTDVIVRVSDRYLSLPRETVVRGEMGTFVFIQSLSLNAIAC